MMRIDPRAMLAAIYRNRFMAGALVLTALVIGVLVTLVTTPIYKATVSVQFETETASVLGDDLGEQDSQGAYDVDRFLQTNLDILKSKALAQRVAAALSLAADDRFFETMGIAPPAAPAPGMTMGETRRAAVAQALRAGLSADLPRNSQIVEVAFSSPDPDLSARVVNSYADNIVAANLQRKFDSTAYARSYLEKQLALAKDRLAQSERAQVEYARRKQLVDVAAGPSADGAGAATASLLGTNLVEANAAFNAARVDRLKLEERFRAAAAGSLQSIPEVQANGTIQSLVNARALAMAEQSRDQERYGADHPVMTQRAQQIGALDQQIARLSGQIRESLRKDYQAARQNEERLQAILQSLRTGNQAEQGDRIQYNILAREAGTNRILYDGLLQRYKELSASAGIASNNISVIDRADRPGLPVSPNPLRNMGIALLAGLIAAAAAVMTREYLDDAVRSPDEVVRKLRLPYLGVVPRMPQGSGVREVLEDPKSSLTEAFAALRTSMDLLPAGNRLQTMTVTSSRESEGKSLVVFGLANAYAAIGRRVLLIDADLRRPSLHRLLGLDRGHGLANVLSGQMDWQDAVVPSGIGGLDFLPAGPLPPSVPELLSGSTLAELVGKAQQEYNVVLIDSPPVLGLADAILLAQVTDHHFYVVEAGRPLRGSGLAAVRRLRGAGVRIDGAILNGFDPKQSGYGYEYGYNYHYGKETA